MGSLKKDRSEYVGGEEAARILSCSDSMARKLFDTGEVLGFKQGKFRRYYKSSLMEYAKKNGIKTVKAIVNGFAVRRSLACLGVPSKVRAPLEPYFGELICVRSVFDLGRIWDGGTFRYLILDETMLGVGQINELLRRFAEDKRGVLVAVFADESTPISTYKGWVESGEVRLVEKHPIAQPEKFAEKLLGI